MRTKTYPPHGRLKPVMTNRKWIILSLREQHYFILAISAHYFDKPLETIANPCFGVLLDLSGEVPCDWVLETQGCVPLTVVPPIAFNLSNMVTDHVSHGTFDGQNTLLSSFPGTLRWQYAGSGKNNWIQFYW